MVYYALVESKLRYSIKFWGNSYRYNIQSAFVAQKRAIRTMARICQTTSCKTYFSEFQILTVPSLYILVLLSDLIKYLNCIETPEDRLKRLATRRMDLPRMFTTKLKVVKHSSGYQAIGLFNKLPAELKCIPYLNIFKNKLKAFLLQKCFYSIEEFLSG
jgi:hypothetical protein